MARLPKKDSAVWRAIITTIEGTFVLVLGLLSLPEVREYIMQVHPQTVPAFALGLAVVNFIRNFFRKDVKPY